MYEHYCSKDHCDPADGCIGICRIIVKHLSSNQNAKYIYTYVILVILEWTTEDLLAKHTSTVSRSKGFNGKI